MITPQQYNEMLESNRGPAKEKITQILSNKIETEAERLEGTPLHISLITYRETTEAEREEWDEIRAGGRRAPTQTVDWVATEVEAEIAVEVLKDAGWYVKGDTAYTRGWGARGFAVTINDVPFEDPDRVVEEAYEEALEEDEQRFNEVKALIVVQQFNAKGWWGRLFTTKL